MLKWILLLTSITSVTHAMDPFMTPITPGDVTVRVQDYAIVPDTFPNVPARMSVLAPDPSGRLFVNDQRGALYRIPDGGGLAESYLDLRDYLANPVVSSSSEAGFQSFTFHPEFATTGAAGYGLFYTMHSTSNTSVTPDFDPGGATRFHSVLLEWRIENHTANTYVEPASGSPFREVLRFDQPFSNHNTGLIAFNPTAGASDSDFGNLYVAVGDGGSSNDPQENGQTLSNPYGAILRIDPLGTNAINGRYGTVADNVFADDEEPAANTLAEIYAGGLRNPQRYGWDPLTGEMYIADIGQNVIEEIDRGVNGGNYGWREREGSLPTSNDEGTPGFIDPVAEYDHTNVVTDPPTGIGNRAITVGEVARGTGIDGLDGLLLLGDFPTGLIFTLDVDSDPLDGGQDGLAELRLVDDAFDEVRLLDLINSARAARGLSESNRADLRFGFNTPGEVFILNKHDGIIRRLTAVPLPASLTLLLGPLLGLIKLGSTRSRAGV